MSRLWLYNFFNDPVNLMNRPKVTSTMILNLAVYTVTRELKEISGSLIQSFLGEGLRTLVYF